MIFYPPYIFSNRVSPAGRGIAADLENLKILIRDSI